MAATTTGAPLSGYPLKKYIVEFEKENARLHAQLAPPAFGRYRKDGHRFGEATHGDIPDSDEFRLG